MSERSTTPQQEEHTNNEKIDELQVADVTTMSSTSTSASSNANRVNKLNSDESKLNRKVSIKVSL
jgi:hypothetical protein